MRSPALEIIKGACRQDWSRRFSTAEKNIALPIALLYTRVATILPRNGNLPCSTLHASATGEDRSSVKMWGNEVEERIFKLHFLLESKIYLLTLKYNEIPNMRMTWQCTCRRYWSWLISIDAYENDMTVYVPTVLELVDVNSFSDWDGNEDSQMTNKQLGIEVEWMGELLRQWNSYWLLFEAKGIVQGLES